MDLIPGIANSSAPTNAQPTYASFANNYTNVNPFTTNSFQACSELYDGVCNTDNLFTFYNIFTTHGGPQYPRVNNKYIALNTPTPLSYYPVGVCSGYTVDDSGNSPCTGGSWYLPAVCQLSARGCAANTQSIAGNIPGLVGNSNGNFETSYTFGSHCMTSLYWSSTEVSGDISSSSQNAWGTQFNTGNTFNGQNSKSGLFGVRCSRALTQ